MIRLFTIFPTDLVEFTDEEGYGRYLDLHDCYLKYINLKSSEVSGHVSLGSSSASGPRVFLCSVGSDLVLW